MSDTEKPTEPLPPATGSVDDLELKRQKAHANEVTLDRCMECGSHAVNPNTDHCMKCGRPQRIG